MAKNQVDNQYLGSNTAPAICSTKKIIPNISFGSIIGTAFLFLAILYTKATFNYILAASIGLLMFYFFAANKIVLKTEYFVYLSIYVFFIALGFNNPVLHIDIKYHLAFVLSLYFVLVVMRRLSNETFVRVVLIAVYVLILINMLMYIQLIPNFARPELVSDYQAYRFYGLNLVLLFGYLLLLVDDQEILRKYQWNVYVIFIFGIFFVYKSGSLQTFVLYVLFYLFAFMRKLNIAFILGFLIMLIPAYYVAQYAMSEANNKKLEQLLHPMESDTIKTRISDLSYAISHYNTSSFTKLFGEGVGSRTEVLRCDQKTGNRCDYFAFWEIDNGWYYIYHRTGILGFACFLGIHLLIIMRIHGLRKRLMFTAYFIVTNTLSIHYLLPISAVIVAFAVRREQQIIIGLRENRWEE